MSKMPTKNALYLYARRILFARRLPSFAFFVCFSFWFVFFFGGGGEGLGRCGVNFCQKLAHIVQRL